MSEITQKIGHGTFITHGKNSDRAYLTKLNKADADFAADVVCQIADEYGYSKVFCKIPQSCSPVFFARGFVLEAYVPKFFNGKEDAMFVSKFTCPHRSINNDGNKLDDFKGIILDIAGAASKKRKVAPLLNVTQLRETQAGAIADIYAQVFETYPFPVSDRAYILDTMRGNVQYFGLYADGELVSVASSEIDSQGQNAEMTDFASLPPARGKGHAGAILSAMEASMKMQGIVSLYTIARLNSAAMNRTFISAGYAYSGTLINNTNIAGSIESMNVLYKHI
jgi:beta-lysine N6-acetyltransferase